MAYKIFISYTEKEAILAEFIRNTINNAFHGNVFLFLSASDILGGEKWKDVIQDSLLKYDACLSVLTPRFKDRPWAYVEWSAFWLQNKTTFLVTTDDVSVQDLLAPMLDSQVSRLFHEEDIKKLLAAIAQAAKVSYIPYSTAFDLAHQSQMIYQRILDEEEKKSLAIYRKEPGLLPGDDYKKLEILWYFLEKERDTETFKEIFQRIRDNSIKGNILYQLIEKNEYAIIGDVYEFVDNKDYLLPVLKKSVAKDQDDSVLMEKLMDFISEAQTTLRSFLQFLIKDGRLDSKLFIYALPLFRNLAELRKVGETLIDAGQMESPLFDSIVSCFYDRNHAELQKLMVYGIRSKNYVPKEIYQVVENIAKRNQREAAKIIKSLEMDLELAEKMIRELIKLRDVLDDLEAWLKAMKDRLN